MATGKGPTPLFEVIRGGDKAGGAKLSVPAWAKPGQPAPASGSGDGSASEGTSTDSGNIHRGGAGLTEWMRNSVRVPRAMIVMVGSIGLVTLLLGGWLAHRMGYESGMGLTRNYEASVSSIDRLREQPAVPLIPASVIGVSDRVSGGAMPQNVNAYPGPGSGTTGATPRAVINTPTPPSASAATKAVGDDPRQPGMNYFRLIVLPMPSVSEAEKIVAFLGKNGVDAAIIPVQNGKALKVVALQGFAKPVSDSAAKQYGERLKSLGRQWQATQKGSSDWKDMFPEKYLPSKN